MKKMNPGRVRMLFPLLHFLLSFLYERTIILFDPDKDVVTSVPYSNIISDGAERVIGYLLAKLFALVFIFFLWQLIFFLYDHRDKKYLRVFAGITLAGMVLAALMWPSPFMESQDNLITYTYALRLWPEYWHSAYSSIIYTACMMVVPHGAAISIFQWIFGMFVVGYLFHRMTVSPVLQGRGRFFCLMILLMPGVYTLFTNAYRTEHYALFCVLLVEKTAMDLVDERKLGRLELAGLMLMCGLACVWRSEGIILGLLLFGIVLLFLQKYKFGQIVVLSVAMVAVFIAFLLPQKIGDKKYYASDYSFINSFPTLGNILNAESSNLSYEGAEEDLAAIDAVTPIYLIQAYGMEGYRRNNFSKGYRDINQSFAGKEVSDAYMSAYYSLVAHNPKIYAKTQIVMLAKMLMLVEYDYQEYYRGVLTAEQDLPAWTLDTWDYGLEDIEALSGDWMENSLHQAVYGFVSKLFTTWNTLLSKMHFYTLLLILIPIYEMYMVLAEIIRAIRKNQARLGLAGIAFVLLLQALAIVLVMPASVLSYLHAYYYASLFLVGIHLTGEGIRIRDKKRK